MISVHTHTHTGIRWFRDDPYSCAIVKTNASSLGWMDADFYIHVTAEQLFTTGEQPRLD